MQETVTTKSPRTTWRLLTCGIATAAILVAWFLVMAPVRSANLSVQLSRLKPGMPYSEVVGILPKSMIYGDKEACTKAFARTTLASADAKPTSQLYCVSKDCWPLNPAASAWLYFDHQDRLIGMYYTALSGGWSPSWGVVKE
jgi:hypothetical protein